MDCEEDDFKFLSFDKDVFGVSIVIELHRQTVRTKIIPDIIEIEESNEYSVVFQEKYLFPLNFYLRTLYQNVFVKQE